MRALKDRLIMSTIQKRLEFHHSAIMYDEKFETWLNLNPLIELQSAVMNLQAWPLTPIYVKNVQLIGYRTLQGFRDGKVSPSRIANSKITPLLPSVILHDIINGRVYANYQESKDIKNLMNLSHEATLLSIKLQVNHLLSSTVIKGDTWAQENNAIWQKKLEQLPIEFVRAYHGYECLLSVMNAHKTLSGMARKDVNYISYIAKKVSYLKSQVLITPDLIIWNYDGVDHLLNRSCFLELFNKVSELQALLLYAWCQTGTSLDRNHYGNCLSFWKHIIHFVKQFYRPMRTTHLNFENQGFTYLKSIEGLGVSELIRRGDEGWGWINDNLGKTLWATLYDEKIVDIKRFSDSELMHIFKKSSVETLAEFIGTVKMVGHPSIDVEAGLTLLYEKTHKALPINEKTRDACVATLTRDIIKVFYNKYKRYPNLRVDNQAHTNLKLLFDKSIPINSVEGMNIIKTIPVIQWAYVVFEKNDEFEIMDNRLAMLKDKALGLSRSKVMQTWLSHERIKRDMVDSKALLHFLFGAEDSMNLKSYFEEFEKDEWTDALMDYLVIKLTAKELELKVKGRFFGASPALERDRRIAMEANVARFMHNLIPDQLLTPNELEVVKKLISFRDYRGIYPKHKIINISFDFSSWNNSMRSDVVDVGAGRILDPWFNTNIYNKTMKAYQNMLVYYDDGLIKRKWEGQDGGIEGLNQATWSIVFIGGIKHALERLGFKYSITVKGDDVRAAIIVPDAIIEKEGLDEFKNRIMTSIQHLCKDMGWSLNPNESFVSLSLIATSKQYLFNDTWLPSSMKKIMKINSHTNGIFTSLEDIIATVFSIAHSACSQTTVVMPSFVTASFTAATVLYRQLNIQQRTKYAIAMMLMWPQILSGPGPLPLQTFFVRGENDMLSAILALYQHILRTSPDVHMKAMVQSILSIPMSDPPNAKMILGDPYCIDLKSPDRPESVMKRQIKRILQRRVKQRDIRELLTSRSEQSCDEFVRILRSITPYHAKVATALWEASPFYLIDELLSKFTHSATVTGFLSQMKSMNTMSRLGQRLWRRVLLTSKGRWQFWESHLIPHYNPSDSLFGVTIQDWLIMCPTDVTNRVRSAQWGPVAGITYPSLITQNYIIAEEDVDKAKFGYGHVQEGTFSAIRVYHKDCSFETPSVSHHYASSTYSKLWLGARTSQKLEYVNIPEATQSPVLRKMKLLLALKKSAGSVGDTIIPLIDKLIEAYTDIPLKDLELLTPINTMSHWAHRIPINSFSLNTMPNCRPNISQLVVVDNETHSVLKEDQTSRTINIAARQFMLNALVTFPLQYSQKLPPTHPISFISLFHHDEFDPYLYRFCPHCCADVEDQVITFPRITNFNIKEFRKLPLVSCGDFETKALHYAIDALKSESHYLRYLPHLETLGVSTAVMTSLRIIVAHHIQMSLDVNFTIRAENMELDFSSPEIVDNILASSGKAPMSSKLVSLHVWRSISSKMLYEAIIQESYIIFINRVIPTMSEVNSNVAAVAIPEVCFYALALLLTRLINVSGLSYLNEGLRHFNYVPTDIPWTFHLDHVQALSQMFFVHHWQLFLTWYLEPDSCPYQETIVMYASDSSLKQGLRGRFNYILTSFFSYIRRREGITWRTLKDTMNRLYIERTPVDGLNALEVTVIQYISYCILSEFVLEKKWDQEDDMTELINDPDHTIDMMKVDLMLPWDELVASITLGSTRPLRDLPRMFTLSIFWASLKARLGDTVPQVDSIVASIVRLCCQDILLHINWYDPQLMLYLSDFRSRYKILSQIRVVRGSLVECERIVKDYATQSSVSRGDQPIITRLPSHMRSRQGADLDEPALPIPRCSLRHRDEGHIRDVHAVLNPEEVLLAHNWVHDSHNADQELSHSQMSFLLDGVDMYRIFGNLNKAYLRWVDVMRQARVNWRETLNNTTAVMIGDGGGSITRHLLLNHPNLSVVFCDKHSRFGPGSPANRMETPVEFLSNCDVELQKRVYHNGFVTGDITLAPTQSTISNLVRQLKRPCNLLISDVVPDTIPYTAETIIPIIYGIITAGFNTCSEGGYIFIRIPMIQRSEWGILLLRVYNTFGHVHIFYSDFDRPEFTSLYLLIVKTGDESTRRFDLRSMLTRPVDQLQIDIWTYSEYRRIIDELIIKKTLRIKHPDHHQTSFLNYDYHRILEREPVVPFNNLIKDWSQSIHVEAKHLCHLRTQLILQLGDRKDRLARYFDDPIRNSLSVQSSYVQLLTEWSVASMIYDGFNEMRRMEGMSSQSMTTIYHGIAQSVQFWINHCSLSQEDIQVLTSVRFFNLRLPLLCHSHLLRLMSWFSLQVYVRQNIPSIDHPWYSHEIDEGLCAECNNVFSGFYHPITFKSRYDYDVRDLVFNIMGY